MRTYLFLTVTVSILCFCKVSQAQLNAGDLAFTGFNSDNEDGFAFVLLNDVEPGTLIRFCDSEWDGAAFGSDEGDFTWNSGNSLLGAGTVVEISSVSDFIAASVGAITIDNSGGISSSSEAMFAFVGPDERTPDTFLGVIANNSAAFGTLDNTGLQLGLTAQVLADGTDIAAYIGVRNGLDRNGYLLALNDLSNWISQDDGDDNDADGISPDLPFDLTPFVLDTTDVTSPEVVVVEVVAVNQITISFSEMLDEADAEDEINYELTPALGILSANYDPVSMSVTLNTQLIPDGVAFTLAVEGIADLAGNVMQPFESDPFIFNAAQPELVITEIMYNPPGDDSDDLEFVEIYNNGAEPASLGGLRFVDEGDVDFTFAESVLAVGETILLATNADFASAFYGVPFIDFFDGSDNVLSNGGEVLTILNSEGEVITEVEYTDDSPWPEITDGDGPSLELLNPDFDPLDFASWSASEVFVGTTSDGFDVFASPGSFNQDNAVTVTFNEAFSTTAENGGMINIPYTVGAVLDNVSIEIVASGVSTAQSGVHLEIVSPTVELQPGDNGEYLLEVNIIDNDNPASEVFFTLSLEPGEGAEAGEIKQHTVFIQDDETMTVDAYESLDVEWVSNILVDDNGSAEIVAFDEGSQRLFVMNSTGLRLHIYDFSDPEVISEVSTVNLENYGPAATSVAVKEGLVATAHDGATGQPGQVVLFDVDGNYIAQAEVGFLPDMVTFSHDGSFLLVSNEGEPNADYSEDPEGSVSRINLPEDPSALTNGDVVHMNFNAFDDQIEDLIASGVRIFGLNATVSRDMEPEFITLSPDDTKAWVSLQENNAIAVVDLVNNVITEIQPLGTIDHSQPGFELDISDRNDSVFFANWPVRGMFMPDALAYYTFEGQGYIVTANEGDQREYGEIDEDKELSDLNLDGDAYPFADILEADHLLGRIAVSPYSGDTDGDGDIDEVHIFGTRSFSIRNADTGELVYDSGSDFERITAADPFYGAIFNASNSNNNFKNRSDNKGPEPEGLTVGTIGSRTYAFVTLERIGGIMTYDITDPFNPRFISWNNNRLSQQSDLEDLGPEGIIYIASDAHITSQGYVVVANEVSATVSVFEVTPGACLDADFDGNGTIGSGDLLEFLGAFGCIGDCGGPDLNGDEVVGTNDLLLFLTLNGALCY